jgi:carboxymethylenebutenolidase
MGGRISYDSNGGATQGYLARPAAPGPEPALGIYAGQDTSVSPAVVAALDEQLTALGKRQEFHTYAGANHAFFNETRPVYDPAAADAAWATTLAFFRKELNA